MSDKKTKYLLWICRSIPNFLWPMRILLFKFHLKNIGDNTTFGPNCLFYDPRLIEIGNNVFIGDKTTISTTVPVKIGDHVMFGPEVMIIGGDHNFSVVGKRMKEVKSGGINNPVIIEDDSWIGARAIILKGVTIKEGSIIGAGSIVSRNTLPYTINAGNPCRLIKPRFVKNQLSHHLKAVGSMYTIDEIVTMYNSHNIEY